MSNLTLTFREDGPVKVSENDFKTYKGMQISGSVSVAYFVWIDEHNSDGVRRLALRDILHEDDKEATKCAKLSCGNIFMAEKPDLATVLEFRPKLLQELSEELWYVLEHGTKIYEAALDRMIELLLRLTGEEKFWPYHALAKDLDKGGINREILLLLLPSRGLPTRLREKIWEKLTLRAKDDLEAPNRYYVDDHGHFGIATSMNGTALKAFCDFFGDTSVPKDSGDVVVAEQIARWLEENLPDNVIYSWHLHGVINYIQHFQDATLAYQVMRRHILNVRSLNENVKFFFWLRGIITYVAPDDKEFLDIVDLVIDNQPHTGKIVFK